MANLAKHCAAVLDYADAHGDPLLAQKMGRRWRAQDGGEPFAFPASEGV
jgi:hypothetical protein